jgi:hypothetical protein
MVVAGAPDDYPDHPRAAAVALVMEVSDTVKVTRPFEGELMVEVRQLLRN